MINSHNNSKNRYYIAILFISFCLSGCELITIGSPKRKQINLDQNTGIGSVFLFKNELDSNNIHGASRLLANNNGKYLIAVDKYEKFPDIFRLMSIIDSKPITYYSTDTLSDKQLKVSIEIDYLNQMSFSIYKINNYWFITEFNDIIKEN